MPYRHLFPYSLPLNKLTATCHSVQKSDILRPKSMKHISAMLKKTPVSADTGVFFHAHR
ncbi:hypothetical protein ECPA45_2429 [Escherichia coli PA45]|nr:hypothetical protein ECPA45_2429 [Escherichia coli PA45]